MFTSSQSAITENPGGYYSDNYTMSFSGNSYGMRTFSEEGGYKTGTNELYAPDCWIVGLKKGTAQANIRINFRIQIPIHIPW